MAQITDSVLKKRVDDRRGRVHARDGVANRNKAAAGEVGRRRSMDASETGMAKLPSPAKASTAHTRAMVLYTSIPSR